MRRRKAESETDQYANAVNQQFIISIALAETGKCRNHISQCNNRTLSQSAIVLCVPIIHAQLTSLAAARCKMFTVQSKHLIESLQIYTDPAPFKFHFGQAANLIFGCN